MQEYLSKTERIQNYIKEILADEQEHSTKEIIEYVGEKLKQDRMYIFQIGSYVNAALRLLMKNGDYAKVAYGVYQKGGIPYTPIAHERESDLEKTDFRSTMISIKAYCGRIEALFSKKPPFEEMEVNEEAAYWAIKKHSLDVARSIRENVNMVLQLMDAQQTNTRNQAIRKYFREYMSDKKPHKMNDIKEYIFSCMVKNKEYNGERSTAYIYSAIKNLIEEEGEYQKISRGVYQIRTEQNVISDGTTYSMDDVGKLLNSGSTLSEQNIENLIRVEFAKIGISNEKIINRISEDLESSINNTSYLIAFAEDYMDRREENEQDEGMKMSGM